MGNDDDPQMRNLLREWRAPDVPASLDARVRALRKPWWDFLLTGSIRVPMPVGLAAGVAFVTMTGALLEQRSERQSAAPGVSLVDFRPVKDVNVRVIRGNDAR